MGDPDLELVRSLQGGDDSALNKLMERYREPLFRFLFRYTGDETAARDLAQETFVRAYFKIVDFRPKALFSTWLFQIAVNLARDRARNKHVKRAKQTFSLPAADHGELMGDARAPSEQMELSEEIARVQRAIAELPHELRSPLVLSVLEDRSHQETGEILRISAKAVETRIYRARRALIEKLRFVR